MPYRVIESPCPVRIIRINIEIGQRTRSFSLDRHLHRLVVDDLLDDDHVLRPKRYAATDDR